MNTNNIKTHIIMKYDLNDHYRSQKVILKFQNHLFLRYIFCLVPNLLKPFQECPLMKTQFLINWSITLKVIQSHIRPPKKIILTHSFIDQFWWKFILMLISSWRHNFLIKIYILPKIFFYVMEKFCNFLTFWPKYNLDLRFYGQLLSLF